MFQFCGTSCDFVVSENKLFDIWHCYYVAILLVWHFILLFLKLLETIVRLGWLPCLGLTTTICRFADTFLLKVTCYCRTYMVVVNKNFTFFGFLAFTSLPHTAVEPQTHIRVEECVSQTDSDSRGES